MKKREREREKHRKKIKHKKVRGEKFAQRQDCKVCFCDSLESYRWDVLQLFKGMERKKEDEMEKVRLISYVERSDMKKWENLLRCLRVPRLRCFLTSKSPSRDTSRYLLLFVQISCFERLERSSTYE